MNMKKIMVSGHVLGRLNKNRDQKISENEFQKFVRMDRNHQKVVISSCWERFVFVVNERLMTDNDDPSCGSLTFRSAGIVLLPERRKSEITRLHLSYVRTLGLHLSYVRKTLAKVTEHKK